MKLDNSTRADTGMLIRRPVAEVFETFVNPEITTKFWFADSTGLLAIVMDGFPGDEESVFHNLIGSVGGFCWVLAGLKAWLEHGIRLNIVHDRFPKGK